MVCMIVDNDADAVKHLKHTIEEVRKDVRIYGFYSPLKALDFAKKNRIDVLFLETTMVEMDGLVLAEKIKRIYPTVNIIFVTEDTGYAAAAFRIYTSGYLLKPATAPLIQEELSVLRYPVFEENTGIYVHTFGNFDIFVDGRPIAFHRSKAKEILAYLVDRKGAGVNKKELAAILWEDEEYTRSKQIQLQTLISEMLSALKEAKAEGIVVRRRNYLAIDPAKINCDFYNFSKENVSDINAYSGEYMSNYSWAETTLGVLNEMQ